MNPDPNLYRVPTELSKNTMTKSILLMSSLEDTYELLCLTCLDFPVKVIHTRDCHSGIVMARSCRPSLIFIDATDILSYNGWVMARIINTDTQLKNIPVVVLSDAINAEQLARKSRLTWQLPRRFPGPYTSALIEQCLDLFQSELHQVPYLGFDSQPGQVTPTFAMTYPQ
jgi:hypothetical protein